MQTPDTATRERAAEASPFRYAVVDLASAVQLRSFVTGLLPAVAVPLFARDASPEVLEVGPWLVRMSQAPAVADALAEIGPDVAWGYYVHSTVDILSLRHSLRRFNLARLPDAPKEVLFRYWDPRVMRVFLRVMNGDQRRKLFEFIDRIDSGDGRFDVAKPK